MLRFNEVYIDARDISAVFQYILCYGSTSAIGGFILKLILFQYILCYGSTLILLECKICPGNFNTSYVTVQQSLDI